MNNTYPTISISILSDLCTRFVMNVPDVESQDVIRIFFQVELAHWFYLDFYCQDDAQAKPCTLKEFCYIIVNFCPTLSKFRENFEEFYESWKNYKQAVPTYGAILLDPTLKYCLMVQGYWLKSSWGFAKGKVNQDESPIDCAIREVLEETSYNIGDKIDPSNFIEKKLNEQTCRLYVVHGIPLDTKFEAQTRSEIKTICWFEVDLLPSHKKDNVCKSVYQLTPNQFFTAIPFIKDLRIRIQQMKSQNFKKQCVPAHPSPPFTTTHSCSNLAKKTNKPILKSKTQAEFFESLLKNSTRKGNNNNKGVLQQAASNHNPQNPSKHPSCTPPATPSTFSTPQSSQPPPVVFYSQPIPAQNNTISSQNNNIISNLFSSAKVSKPLNPKLSSHSIKSLQKGGQPSGNVFEKAEDKNEDQPPSREDDTITTFSFEAPAWNTFSINVESVMAAIFEP